MSDVPGGQRAQPPERVSETPWPARRPVARSPRAGGLRRRLWPARCRPGGAMAELALLKLAVPDERAGSAPIRPRPAVSELAQLVDVHDHLGAGPAEMQVDQQALAAARMAA